ncbi:MAG TPA: hypothetical protein VN025_10020 [Candidatus Dormibacteraeota bacterium]|jgi:hypothetical protein|nr:hypothetical protein [Candidatus Dormibacteraeota bacterium]
MSETPGQSTTGKSILAVFAGFVVVIVITLTTDAVLHWMHFYPPLGEYTPGSALIWATIYRTIYGIIGSYITARLAPTRPMKHALIGGAIGLVLATIGAVVTWNRVPSLGPHWYPVSLIIGALPTAWLGAKIRIMQTGSH